MNALRRYEILLPLRFNDGRPVPEALLVQTVAELRERFGADSWETQSLHGEWEHAGTVYQDDLTRFFVDVPDVSEHREFFREFKERLKVRFNQLEIWITSHPLDAI